MKKNGCYSWFSINRKHIVNTFLSVNGVATVLLTIIAIIFPLSNILQQWKLLFEILAFIAYFILEFVIAIIITYSKKEQTYFEKGDFYVKAK